MKTLYLCFSLLGINAVCSAMHISDDHHEQSSDTKTAKDKQKILSMLFKLMHKNESPDELCITKKPKDSYTSHLNNFHQHTEALRNAIEQKNSDDKKTITKLRSKIITEDLIPLKYKIINILNCMKQNNLYPTHFGQTPNKIEHSPRIQIIDSIITILKEDTAQLDHKTIENYQYIMNYIVHFSIQKNGTMTDNQILAALETVAVNTENNAQQLATLLHDEMLNLKKCKKILAFPAKNIIDDYLPSIDTNKASAEEYS
jgi:hypothetical protein